MPDDASPRAKRTTFRRTMAMVAVAEAANDTAFPRYNVTTTASGAASKTSQFETDLHGNVNILLGGAMLSGVIMVVFLMCYCCHKSIRKSRPQEYPQYWRTEPDVHSLEVFTTEAHAAYCERQSTTDGNQDESTYGALSCPVTPISGPGPPPTYDSLIFEQRSLPGTFDKKPDAVDTPGVIIPSMVSTLLGLSTAVRSAECNEATEQETADEGLPSYEAALKLDANGYV
ncbi:unnamed protein product [Xylocopa violacea]|uniref:Uncharacterized protein n=1 Tax=Xylocopa violacea TaxID=135666 RepID=A0ABP1NHP2_XYLVO